MKAPAARYSQRQFAAIGFQLPVGSRAAALQRLRHLFEREELFMDIQTDSAHQARWYSRTVGFLRKLVMQAGPDVQAPDKGGRPLPPDGSVQGCHELPIKELVKAQRVKRQFDAISKAVLEDYPELKRNASAQEH